MGLSEELGRPGEVDDSSDSDGNGALTRSRVSTAIGDPTAGGTGWGRPPGWPVVDTLAACQLRGGRRR